MVTESLIKAAMEKYKTPKEMAVAINSVLSVEKEASSIRNEMNRVEGEYKKQMDALNKKLAVVKSSCPHLVTSYHPDPSGNSDSYHECEHCEKTM